MTAGAMPEASMVTILVMPWSRKRMANAVTDLLHQLRVDLVVEKASTLSTCSEGRCLPSGFCL